MQTMFFLRTLRNYLPHWLVNYFFHLPLAFLAVIFHGYPGRKIKIIGVTGTDGKTTTATLIYEILKTAKKRVALISTVCAKIGSKNIDTGFHVTTPNPWQLQKLLKLAVKEKIEYLVLEATSQGLAQFRLFGCNFKVGVITNLTHEHLDYHQTMEAYLKAKAKLFKNTELNILNREDQSYKFLFNLIKKKTNRKIITYGLKEGDFTPKKFTFRTKLAGKFNLYNCLAAVAVAKSLGIANFRINKTLAHFKGVKGRMEVVCNQPYKIIVDFAHTPNALQQALKTLKEMPHRQLIAVFGAAGLRDRTKRPTMGKIAGLFADKIILTAEDPRTESVNKIIEEIAAGCPDKSKIIKEPDRKKAINRAILLAKPGDIIGIFGKGHEQSMCFGNREYPWSDQEVVKKFL